MQARTKLEVQIDQVETSLSKQQKSLEALNSRSDASCKQVEELERKIGQVT